MFARVSHRTRRSLGGEPKKTSLREALRNRGGAPAAALVTPAASEAEDEPEKSGLDWLNLTAFAPKNLQSVIEKLRADHVPTVVRKFDADTEEARQARPDGENSESEEGVEIAIPPPILTAINQRRTVNNHIPGGSTPSKARKNSIRAALQARGGMQRPMGPAAPPPADPPDSREVQDEAWFTPGPPVSPSAHSQLSPPLPAVEEDHEAEADDREAVADVLADPVNLGGLSEEVRDDDEARRPPSPAAESAEELAAEEATVDDEPDSPTCAEAEAAEAAAPDATAEVVAADAAEPDAAAAMVDATVLVDAAVSDDAVADAAVADDAMADAAVADSALADAAVRADAPGPVDAAVADDEVVGAPVAGDAVAEVIAPADVLAEAAAGAATVAEAALAEAGAAEGAAAEVAAAQAAADATAAEAAASETTAVEAAVAEAAVAEAAVADAAVALAVGDSAVPADATAPDHVVADAAEEDGAAPVAAAADGVVPAAAADNAPAAVACAQSTAGTGDERAAGEPDAQECATSPPVAAALVESVAEPPPAAAPAGADAPAVADTPAAAVVRESTPVAGGEELAVAAVPSVEEVRVPAAAQPAEPSNAALSRSAPEDAEAPEAKPQLVPSIRVVEAPKAEAKPPPVPSIRVVEAAPKKIVERAATDPWKLQHFNKPQPKLPATAEKPLPWKAEKPLVNRRHTLSAVQEKEDPAKELREAPKKLKEVREFWGKNAKGFAGPAIGSKSRLSKCEAQATLQRLIAAGGAVDFDEVRRLRKMIAELE